VRGDEITEAQRAFLHASDEAETARLSKERTQIEEMRLAQAATTRHQKRAGRLLWTMAAFVLVVFGIWIALLIVLTRAYS